MKIDRHGIRFLYAEVLAQSWPGLDFAKAPKTQRLPDSLTPNERARILHITRRFDLQCLGFVTDTLGLRLGDTRRLECADIDRERGQVPIRPPKGHQARFVLLPSMTLPVLRKLWCPHRHPRGVFPRRDGASAPGSLDRANGQKGFQQAVADARVLKRVSIHSLRHSDAPPKTLALRRRRWYCAATLTIGRVGLGLWHPPSLAGLAQATARLQQSPNSAKPRLPPNTSN